MGRRKRSNLFLYRHRLIAKERRHARWFRVAVPKGLDAFAQELIPVEMGLAATLHF